MLITSGVLFLSLNVIVYAHYGPVLKTISITWGTNSDTADNDGLFCAFLNIACCITERPLKNHKSAKNTCRETISIIIGVTMLQICSNEPIQQVRVNREGHETKYDSFSFKDGSKNKYEIHESLIFLKLEEIDQEPEQPEYFLMVDVDQFPIPISKVAVEELLKLELKFMPTKRFIPSVQNNNQLARYYKARICNDIPHYVGRDQFCFELIDYPIGELRASFIEGVLVHPDTDEICGIVADWDKIYKWSLSYSLCPDNIVIIRVTLLTSFIDQFDNFVSGNDNTQEVTEFKCGKKWKKLYGV